MNSSTITDALASPQALADSVNTKEMSLTCYRMFIRLRRNNDGQWEGEIHSNLRDHVSEDCKEYLAAVLAIETMVLNHACRGIEVESLSYANGIERAVDAISI